MSKRYRTERASVERSILYEITCDLCGKKVSGGYTGNNWATGFELAETTVLLKEGEQYRDGGSGKTFTVDICPDCFRGTLIPWLQSQGATVREEDWDW